MRPLGCLLLVVLIVATCGCMGNMLNITVYSQGELSSSLQTGNEYIIPVTIVNYGETPFHFDRIRLSYGPESHNKSVLDYDYGDVILEREDTLSETFICRGANYDTEEDIVTRLELIRVTDGQEKIVWAGQTNLPHPEDMKASDDLVDIFFKEEHIDI